MHTDQKRHREATIQETIEACKRLWLLNCRFEVLTNRLQMQQITLNPKQTELYEKIIYTPTDFSSGLSLELIQQTTKYYDDAVQSAYGFLHHIHAINDIVCLLNGICEASECPTVFGKDMVLPRWGHPVWPEIERRTNNLRRLFLEARSATMPQLTTRATKEVVLLLQERKSPIASIENMHQFVCCNYRTAKKLKKALKEEYRHCIGVDCDRLYNRQEGLHPPP